MALTIRNIDPETRKLLNKLKKDYEIATDSKALIKAVHLADFWTTEANEIEEKLETEQDRADDAERILETLRDSMKSALTILDQKELKL